MRIGDLAKLTNTPTRLLRYYEQQDLIRPSRQANGYRSYGDDDIDRVLRIRGLIECGIPTRVIREMIPCLDYPDKPTISEADPKLMALLLEERDRMSQRITFLRRNRDALTTYIDAARERNEKNSQKA